MKRYLPLALKTLVTLTCLGILAHSISWASLLAVFQSLHAGWAILALLIFWAAQIVSAFRYARIAGTLGGNLDFATALRAHFLGLWFNQVLPTSLGGDVVKIAVLKPRLGLGLSLRTAILDRISGLAFLMLAIVVTLPLYAHLLPDPKMTVALGALSIASLLGLILAPWLAIQARRLLHDQHRLARFMQVLVDLSAFRHTKPLWEQTWTSGIVHVNGIIAYGLLGLALGVNVNWLHFALMVPLVFLVALLPLSFAGWGVREAGAIWLFRMVGIEPEIALAMSISFGLMLVMAGAPGLMIFLRQPGIRQASRND